MNVIEVVRAHIFPSAAFDEGKKDSLIAIRRDLMSDCGKDREDPIST